MDALLARLGVQAMNYAIRSGIALTSSYAVQQCSRLLKTVDDKGVYAELKALQNLLSSRIKIISPAIDLIEFKSGRGNVFLESAVPLAKSLHRDIVSLGKRLESAASEEEGSRHSKSRQTRDEEHQAELLRILRDINSLLTRIDRDIPLIQLAITASGESLSTSLPPGVSPSRLLQASTFLIVGDTQFANDPGRPVQIGPSFALSLYMLFVGHGRSTEPYGLGDGERKPVWQEVLHKARVRLCRTPLCWAFDAELGYCPAAQPFSPSGRPDEFSYHLEIVEDLDDGRLHDEDGAKPSLFDDIPQAGIRESIPVHQIAKIFYTDTGRILNIGTSPDGDSNPVLLLKRDVHVAPPQQAAETGEAPPDEQADVDRQLQQESGPEPWSRWTLPRHVDPEWLALEIYTEDEEGDEDEEEDDEEEDDKPILSVKPARSSVDAKLLAQIRNISIRPSGAEPAGPEPHTVTSAESFVARSPFGAITSSLSLLEMLVRLTSLQEFQQTTHLAIPDHILTFFLEETSTTGLRGEERWKARSEAKRRVGFDPYTDGGES